MSLLVEKHFPRTTQPFFPELAKALTPLMAVVQAESFHLSWIDSFVVIGQAGWEGVDLLAVQAAVDAAPAWTNRLDARDRIGRFPVELWAAFRVLVKYDTGSLPAGSIAKFKTDVLNEVDSLT